MNNTNIEEQESVLEETETTEEIITDTEDIEDTTNTNTPTTSVSNTITSPTNMDMMIKIAEDKQTLEDIKNLTSTKVTDQLKVFLVTQARNDLMRIVKLTRFLDTLEDKFMNKVNESITDNTLTLKQYSDVISVITQLLTRANETVTKVLRDDSLMTILNTTIYNTDSSVQSTSIVANLKDPQSRERVRSVINTVLQNTNMNIFNSTSTDNDVITVESEGSLNEV